MSAQEVASEPPAVLTDDPVRAGNTSITQDAQVVAHNEPELTNNNQAQSGAVNGHSLPPENTASKTEITIAAAEDQSRGVVDEEAVPQLLQDTAKDTKSLTEEITKGEDLAATPPLATYPDNTNLISTDVDGIVVDSSNDLAPQTMPITSFDNTPVHTSDSTEITHKEPVTEQETLQEGVDASSFAPDVGVTTSDKEPFLQLSEARPENKQSTDGGQDGLLTEEKSPEHDELPSDTQIEIPEEKTSIANLSNGSRAEPDSEGLTLDLEVMHPESLLSKVVTEETHETQVANAEVEMSHPEIDAQSPTPHLVEHSLSTQEQDEQLYSAPQNVPDVPTEVVQNDAAVEKRTSLHATDSSGADIAEASLPPETVANIADGQEAEQEADETEDEGPPIQDHDTRNDESSLQTALQTGPEASREVLNQPEDAVEISLDVVDDQGIDVTGSAIDKSSWLQPEVVPPVQVDVSENPAVVQDAAEPAKSDDQPVVHDLGKSDEHTEVTTLPQYDSHLIEDRSFDQSLLIAEIEPPLGNLTPHSPEVNPLVIPDELGQSQRHDTTGAAISTEDEVSKDTDVAFEAPVDLPDEPTILESAPPLNHDSSVSVNLPTAGGLGNELDEPSPEERPLDEDHSTSEPAAESENLVEEVEVLTSGSRGEEQSPNNIPDEVATPEAPHVEQQTSYPPEPQTPSFEDPASDNPKVQEAPEDMIVSHDSLEVEPDMVRAPEEATGFTVDQATTELATEDPAFTHNILEVQPNALSVDPTASDNVPIAAEDTPQIAQEITEDIAVQAEATANNFLVENITQSTSEVLEPTTVDASEPTLAVMNDSSEAQFDQPEVALADLVGVPDDKSDSAGGILEDDTLGVGVVPSDVLVDSNPQSVSDEVQATDKSQLAVLAEIQDVQSEVVSVDIGQVLGEVSKPVEPESDAVIDDSPAIQSEGIPAEIDVTKRDAATEVLSVDEETDHRVPIPPENAQGQHHAVADLGQSSVQERSSPSLGADTDQAFETNGVLLAAIAEPTITANEREAVEVVPEPAAEAVVNASPTSGTEIGTLDPENDSEDVNLVAPALNEVVLTATPGALLATGSAQGPSVENDIPSVVNLSVTAPPDLVEETVTPPQFDLDENPEVIREEELQLHDFPAAIPDFTQSSETVPLSFKHEHEEQKLLEESTPPSDGYAPTEPATSQVFLAEQPDFTLSSTEEEVLVPSSAPVEEVSTLSEEIVQEASFHQEPTAGQTSSQSETSVPVIIEEMLITDALPTSFPDEVQEAPNNEIASSDMPITHPQDNVSTVFPLKEANEEGIVSNSSEVVTPTLDGVNVLVGQSEQEGTQPSDVVEQSETGMDAAPPLETRNVAESATVMLPTLAVQDHDDPNLNNGDLVVQGDSVASELPTELPGAQDREPAALFFKEVSTKLASSEVDIERPKSPWTPSFSVTTQGPGIVPEEDIEPAPLSKEALVVPGYPNLADDTVDSTQSTEQLERPWTPSYSVFVQGGSPHQEPKDELPVVSSLEPQESPVLFASDVPISTDDEPATMDPKEERQVLLSLSSRAELEQATASDVQSGTQSEASVEPQATFAHSVVPLEDITATVPRTENQISTSSREPNVVDVLGLSRPVQDGRRSEATKENLPPSNEKPVQKVDLQDELPPVEFPKLADVGERALKHRLSLTVINENSEDHAVSKPTDAETSPSSPRARLASTASSLMFPGGWFGKIPEGRTSLDNAHGVFAPPKPSASVLQPAPPPALIAPSDEHERKGKWCIVM